VRGTKRSNRGWQQRVVGELVGGMKKNLWGWYQVKRDRFGRKGRHTSGCGVSKGGKGGSPRGVGVLRTRGVKPSNKKPSFGTGF